jgi:hypothetical protein
MDVSAIYRLLSKQFTTGYHGRFFAISLMMPEFKTQPTVCVAENHNIM